MLYEIILIYYYFLFGSLKFMTVSLYHTNQINIMTTINYSRQFSKFLTCIFIGLLMTIVAYKVYTGTTTTQKLNKLIEYTNCAK